MEPLLRPQLFPGARVAIIGPSSYIGDGKLERCVRAAESLGLEPVVYESARSSRGYLSGPDALRAGDINAAFARRVRRKPPAAAHRLRYDPQESEVLRGIQRCYGAADSHHAAMRLCDLPLFDGGQRCV